MDYDEEATLYRKHNLDDILPFQYIKVFDAFPYAVKDVVVRAVGRLADRWIDGYCQSYQSRYGMMHPPLRAEDRIECRKMVIPILMYGVDWLDFDRMASGYMRNTDADHGLITEFLIKMPVLNPL